MLYYSVVSVGSAKVYAAHKNIDSTSAFWFSQVWSLNRDYFIIQSFRVFCLVVSQHGSATVQCKFISQASFSGERGEVFRDKCMGNNTTGDH